MMYTRLKHLELVPRTDGSLSEQKAIRSFRKANILGCCYKYKKNMDLVSKMVRKT